MSIKVDIISGFLGAGKTSLIRKMFENGFNNEKVVLIENEFGEIGIDGSFLKEAGVDIKEINSGCICCSLVGDFAASMAEVVNKFTPDRIIIEPSGVGKLSDIVKAVEELDIDLKLNIIATVVDGGKCKIYMKNFGEFFNNQVQDAKTIIVSKVEKLSDEKIIETYNLLKGKNPNANIILANLLSVDPKKLVETLEKTISPLEETKEELEHHHGCCCGHHDHEHHEHENGHCCCGHHDHEHHEHEEGHCCCGHHEHEHHEHEEGHCCCGHHEHEHHEHEEGHCCCGHHEHEHHEHEEGHCCCGHHEHEHHEHEDGHCCCGHHEHEHHEHEDGHCCCGHHDHEHHHADEVFVSYGFEIVNSYSKNELEEILTSFQNEEKYGIVLRAKGILRASDNENWYYFDYVAGDYTINLGTPDFMGRFVVIGSHLNKENIEQIVLKK